MSRKLYKNEENGDVMTENKLNDLKLKGIITMKIVEQAKDSKRKTRDLKKVEEIMNDLMKYKPITK